jgi:uncharacterized protein YpmS
LGCLVYTYILYKFSTTILYILYDKREIGIIFQEECLRGCVCLRKFIAVIFLFIILLVGLYFFVSPVRNVEKLDQTASLSSLAQEKSAHATSLELNGGSPILGYRLSESDVNDYLRSYLYENDETIDGAEAELIPEHIKFYINKHVVSFMESQFVVDVTPNAENGKLVLKVNSVHLGRMPIPMSLIWNRLNIDKASDVTVDKEMNEITLLNNLPDSISFEQADTTDEYINLSASVTIDSLRDIINLAPYLIPKDIQRDLSQKLNLFGQ